MMSWERTIDDALNDADYILEAVKEVRDPEIKPSEYDFLDELEKIHPAPAKKGNDGLANFVANLAIYKENYKDEEDESIEIDQGLIKEADRRIGEADELRNPARRKRINNIVQDSDSRGGSKESMQYNIKERNLPDGHRRLIKQASAIYKAAGKEDEGREKIQNILKDTDLSLNDTNWDDSNPNFENHEKLKGGENEMTDEEYESAEALLSDVEAGEFDSYDDVIDTAEGLGMDNLTELYVLGEAVMTMASEDSIDAERKSNLLLTYKRATDELVGELDDQFNQLRAHYIEEMNDHAVAHRNNGERSARISDNMDEGIENLNSLNQRVSDTLEDSGVPELTDLKDSLGSSSEYSEE